MNDLNLRIADFILTAPFVGIVKEMAKAFRYTTDLSTDKNLAQLLARGPHKKKNVHYNRKKIMCLSNGFFKIQSASSERNNKR